VIPRYLLPPVAYSSADWFEREQASLFGSRWALVAATDELTLPGDYVTATAGRAPLVVVRGDDGGLRAFHNLCRHRGMVLLQGSGTLDRTITCFYHQWRYGLDGTLQVVPQRKDQFPGLDVRDWGLLPASVEVWEGMVFAHPDQNAPPLVDTLAGIPEHIGSHRPGLLTQVAVRHLEARCNWKLFVENHVDVYHLWHLHATTLADFDHTRFEHLQTGRNWASYEPLKHPDLAGAALTSGTDQISHLDERDRYGLGAHLVFPNLMIATAAEFFATYMAIPVAPDRSVIELRMRAEPGADSEAVTTSAVSFIEEDIRACEAVQQAVASPAFRVGPLAVDHERPIASFHTNILQALDDTTGVPA
jgi:phenylpropionate dioxygenase-like ring-hydroxylating dioxygenase large terminal subunit